MKYPKIQSVEPLKNIWLKVTFEGNIVKYYDCSRLASSPSFSMLQKEWFFKSFRLDSGGYGISWDGRVDLAESELWENGTAREPAGV